MFNYRIYNQEYRGVKRNLIRMEKFVDRNTNISNEDLKDFLNDRLIMDYNVYTILLGKNNNIIGKISHNDGKFYKKILKEAKTIISEEEKEKFKIDSLYFNSFAYNFIPNKVIIIVDTSVIKNNLIMTLLKSLLVFSISECIVLFISIMITNWITKPVENSFNNQKDFIANASHELKTPLGIIMASIDCIKINKNNKKWIGNIKEETERMNNLITKLLELSKSENKYSKQYELSDISKIIKKRVMTFESLAYENMAEIVTNISDNIMFLCNNYEIDELVSILVDNAIKHSEKNSKIKVNLSEEKNYIILEVINRGIPIEKSDSEKIFERFYRLDKSRNRKENRYGLGLSIAKNIVNNHKGNIKAYSCDGYTIFKVVFKK